MTLIKTVDVKNYLSSPRRNGFRLHRPATQPDATGFSGQPSGRADFDARNTVEATANRSSSSAMDAPQTTACGPPADPATRKSAQG